MSYYGRKLALGITGTILSTMSISYLVEKIFSEKYEVEGTNRTHYFAYPSLITWLGCLFCSIYGMIYASLADQTPNSITFQERFRLGLLFTLNYLPTNYALLYISYPLQVIAKNTRYFFVVIVGVYYSRVQKSRTLKLPRSKVVIAVIISVGAGLFMYFDSNKSSIENHFHPNKKWIGFMLLLLAIICDALFSDSQAYCKATFKPSQNQLFLAANLYGFVLIFLFSILSGELGPSLVFVSKHPQLQKDLLMVVSLQVVSQISVYYVISNFKQHIYPLISTVRKLLTILFSIYIFKHKITFYQWTAIAIVFVAMGYQLYDQVQSQEQNRQVRKEREKKQYLEKSKESKSKDGGEDLLKESGERKDSEEVSQDKDAVEQTAETQNSRRPNSFLNRPPQNKLNSARAQSNSKYSYGWRKTEVTEDRESSLSPQKLM